MKKIFLLFIFFLSTLAVAQSGKVIKIKDGDTVVILDQDYNNHTIRIADIDCPEKGQPFSEVARQFTASEIFGKQVQVVIKNKDKYGRTVGYVLYDEKNLSHELLKAGLAWHYKYYSKDSLMTSLELQAKENKIGLWSDPNPINPYLWRKSKK